MNHLNAGFVDRARSADRRCKTSIYASNFLAAVRVVGSVKIGMAVVNKTSSVEVLKYILGNRLKESESCNFKCEREEIYNDDIYQYRIALSWNVLKR